MVITMMFIGLFSIVYFYRKGKVCWSRYFHLFYRRGLTSISDYTNFHAPALSVSHESHLDELCLHFNKARHTIVAIEANQLRLAGDWSRQPL